MKSARTANGRRVLFVTSEAADYAKVGGLGDVSAALPRALRRRHDARLPTVASRAGGVSPSSAWV